MGFHISIICTIYFKSTTSWNKIKIIFSKIIIILNKHKINNLKTNFVFHKNAFKVFLKYCRKWRKGPKIAIYYIVFFCIFLQIRFRTMILLYYIRHILKQKDLFKILDQKVPLKSFHFEMNFHNNCIRNWILTPKNKIKIQCNLDRILISLIFRNTQKNCWY